MKNPQSSPSAATIAAYLEGELGASERAALEAELAASPQAERRLARVRELCDALASPLPEVERIDLTGSVRDGIRRGAASPRPRAARAAWASVAAALAVAAGVVLAVRGGGSRGEEFREKGASSRAATWAGFQAHRVPKGGSPEPLGERLGKDDGLAFSYTNLGPRPFEYLILFARDARGEIRWFEPPYEQAGGDPTSLPIVKGASRTPISEVIFQEFAPGSLEIHAVFSRRPLHVLDVEKQLAGASSAEIALDGCVEQSVWTTVEP
jgi:hypothetical protein